MDVPQSRIPHSHLGKRMPMTVALQRRVRSRRCYARAALSMNRESFVGSEWCSCVMSHSPSRFSNPTVSLKSSGPADVPSQCMFGCDECDAFACCSFHIGRLERDRSTFVLEEKIPRAIVRIELSDF